MQSINPNKTNML